MTSEAEHQDTLVQYQKYLDQSGLSQATIKSYIGDMRQFASWLERARTRSLLEGTDEDIRGYSLELVRAKAHPVATVNRHLQSIRKFFRYAMQSGLVEHDPSVRVKLLPQPKSRVSKGLDESEMESFLDAVQQGPPHLVPRDYAIVQLMLQTGIRVGELTRLRLPDVSLSEERGVLKIRGQGAPQDREVPLNGRAREAMKAYLENRPTEGGDHLFLTQNGDPLSVRSVQRLVNTYAQAAGLEKVSTYTLRQTCGEHILRDTGDLHLVARLMGHKRLETAIKYVQPQLEDSAELAE